MMCAAKYRDTSIGYGECEDPEVSKGRNFINMQKFSYVCLLEQVGKEDLARAGGKGANLGEMIRAGLPVPEGFVVLVDGYKKFVEENDLQTEISRLITETGVLNGNQDALKLKTTYLQERFERGEIPVDVKQEIGYVYDYLEKPRVAVRSSAMAEDLPGASFAGQYSTYLNIAGKEELYQAIKKCWASLWNERAVSYRAKQDIDDTGLAHGVVVQRQINSEKSGILFTANPVNGRRDQVSLSSSWGLGEAIVGGEVDPDQWIINKKDGKTVDEYIATKKVQTVRTEGGTVLAGVEKERQNEVTMDQEERKRLLDLACRVEEHYGFPQDLEWAYQGGRFYLVQTRPVTALFPMPEPEDTDDKLHVYINISLYSQGMHEPFTPLGLDLFMRMYLNVGRRMNRRYLREPVLWNKSAAGRLFFDITELIKLKKVQGELKTNPMFNKDPVTIDIIMHLLERDSEALSKPRTPVIKTVKGFFTKVNPWIIKYIFSSIPKLLYGKFFPGKALTRAFKYGDQVMADIERSKEGLDSRKDKLEFIERTSPDYILFIAFEIMFYGIVSLNYFDQARNLISKYAVDPEEVEKVEKAVPNCITTEMGLDMLQAAKRIDQAGEEPSPGHPEITYLLEKYGHRSVAEIDVGMPGWKEDPEYVTGLIRSYVEHKTYRQGIEKFYREQEEAEKAIENVVSRLKLQGAGRDAAKVRNWLKGHREMYGIREYPKFVLLKAIATYREILLEIGAELQEEGSLEHKGDVFMLTLKDLESGEKLQEKVRQNRWEYEKETKRASVPRIMTGTGETFYSAPPGEGDGPDKGVPVSPGYFEGTIKVLNTPGEAEKLNQGDIMVTAATNPAWTPLFMIIGGLIMETGGPISHGSVVAREYGIPAVVGVKNATTRFQDGQKVRINGETGELEILSG